MTKDANDRRDGESAADARERNDRYLARNVEQLADKLNTWLDEAHETGLTMRVEVREIPTINLFGVERLPSHSRISVELSRAIKPEPLQ